MNKIFLVLTILLFLFAFNLYSEEKKEPEKKVEKQGIKRSEKDTKPTLIVFDVVPEKGVEKGAANIITEIVLSEIFQLKRYNVIGQNDLDKMLFWETNKQLKNCTDTSCMAQIAGAMGAEYYVVGSVGAMGDRYLISLKMINVLKAEVESREMGEINKDENELIKQTRILTKRLMGVEEKGEEIQKEGKVEGVVDKGDKGKIKSLIGYTAIGIGVVAGIGGVIYNMKAEDAVDSYNKSVDTREKYKVEIEDNRDMAMILYIAGGSLITGGVLYLIFGKGDSKDTKGAGVEVGIGISSVEMIWRY